MAKLYLNENFEFDLISELAIKKNCHSWFWSLLFQTKNTDSIFLFCSFVKKNAILDQMFNSFSL